MVVVQAFGGMFCVSGLLGMYGSCITLAGFCMSRHFAVSGISIFKIKVQIMGAMPWCQQPWLPRRMLYTEHFGNSHLNLSCSDAKPSLQQPSLQQPSLQKR